MLGNTPKYFCMVSFGGVQRNMLTIEKLDVHPEDIESRSMGAGGEDLIMARAAREKFPFSIECKNVEKCFEIREE